MIESNRDLFLQEILDYRREFCQRFNPATTPAGALREVDYVLACYLMRRLDIPAVHTDASDQGKFLTDQIEKRRLKAEKLLTESNAETAPPATSAKPAEQFAELHLLNPSGDPSPTWPAIAGVPGNLMLLYGVAGEMSASSLETITRLAHEGGDAVAFLPRGSTPALWRSTAMLLVKPTHRTLLLEALQDFTAVFAGSELDALKLAEENFELKASNQRLSMQGTNQGELDRLRALITKLESELAAIRRSVLQQEKSQLAAQARKPAIADIQK